MRTLTEGLRSDGFAHKIALIPPAIPSRRTFVKKPDGEVIRILFVGSGNIKGQFDVKGGREVLETFLHLRRRYSGIELVVRSDVPPDVRSKFTGVEGLRLIEDGISSEQIEREYQASDIFLLPSHSTPPFTFLDAMSFELPVVSIDTWANGEFIVDGATGLLARRSQRIPYSFRGTLHPNFGTGRFAEAVRHVDERVIGDLVEKAGLLIENADLRRSLGRQARWEVEHGRFSIGERNRRLGRFFELALHDRTSGADKGPLL
jgi:glycosyltransferase involved in cell wall biosynthesis